jgi:glycosyltransferase involved in cell wall biosynthesis
MCCGTPVLTTRCGGGPECITDGLDGWLVRERDVDALADVIRSAASDRERAWTMGTAARRTAELRAGSGRASSLPRALKRI